MAELFKNIYNELFFDRFVKVIKRVETEFDEKSFLHEIFDEEWEDRELKQRMRHITLALKKHLKGDFKNQVETILAFIPELKKDGFKSDTIEFIFLPDFIEIYGIEEYEISIDAFEKITQFVSCEFAVRPFIIKYKSKMLQQMTAWADHKHPMVRRLATEGCRPRLPWGLGIAFLKEDPSPILPILEKLKNDESESVRRSVANNLNDISKDNPASVIHLLKKWKGVSPETDWLRKHASRTLLKQGNTEMMRLFGFGDTKHIEVNELKVLTSKVEIGEKLAFSFQLKNNNNSESLIRLEYGIYFQKANGSLSRKVFKISEKKYAKNSSTVIHRKQPFKVITTRKLYKGKHQVSIIVNGKEFEKKDFELI